MRETKTSHSTVLADRAPVGESMPPEEPTEKLSSSLAAKAKDDSRATAETDSQSEQCDTGKTAPNTVDDDAKPAQSEAPESTLAQSDQDADAARQQSRPKNSEGHETSQNEPVGARPENGDNEPTEVASPDEKEAVSSDQEEQPPTSTISPWEVGNEKDTSDGTLGQSPESRGQARMRSKANFNAPGYELLEAIGEGTFGVVWKAKSVATGYEVAIKFLTFGGGLSWQLLQAELRQLAQFHEDPGIIQLIDTAPDAEPPYFVMKYAEKGSLAQKLKTDSLPLPKALELFRQIVKAIAYVHEKGILHCDLKPGNILLDAREHALVADFGQSHLTSNVSTALGTFFYMAPEQAVSKPQLPDTRWDVYALGAIFYHMLTGHPARDNADVRKELRAEGKSLSARLKRYREWVKEAPPPKDHYDIKDIDSHLGRIIDRCLAVEPEQRYRNAGEVQLALKQRDRRLAQRPLLIAGLVLPLVLLVVMSLLVWGQASLMLRNTQDALEEQLGESNMVGARLAASKVRDQLKQRLDYLVEKAREKDFRQWVRDKNEANLRTALEGFERQHQDRQLHFVDRWIVIDASNGKYMANYPEGRTADGKPFNGQNFSWREYYNGVADKLDEKDIVHRHITSPHISRFYKSVAKTGGGNRFGVSVPIYDSDLKQKIIGVFVMTIKLDHFNEWLQEIHMKDGFVELISQKGLMWHNNRWRVADNRNAKPVKTENKLYQKALASTSDQDKAYEKYEHPIFGKQCLGGYAPIHRANGTPVGWALLVQHDYEKVTRPVSDLRWELIVWGVVMCLVAGILLFGMWMVSLRLLRREEHLTHG